MIISRREFLLGSALATLSLRPALLSALQHDTEWHELNRPMIGSFVAIGIYYKDRNTALSLIDQCFNHLSSIIPSISVWDADGVPNQIARSGSAKTSKLPESLHQAILIGQKVKALTGSYNLLCGPLTNLWKSAKQSTSIPTKRDVEMARKQVENSQLRLDSKLELSNKCYFDLDGIGPGILADYAAKYLALKGVSRGRVDVGGELRFIGDATWQVEIEDSREEQIVQTIELKGSRAVCTSGDSRNFWKVNGQRYHHLIDLTTGYPATYNQQVSVIGPNAAFSDALASALFLLPKDRIVSIINRLSDVQAFVIDARGNGFWVQ